MAIDSVRLRADYMDRVIRYLKETGAISRIDQLYTIHFTLKWDHGQVAALQCRGGMDYDEVMKRLLDKIRCSDRDRYTYDYIICEGWKTVQPCWGPDHDYHFCFLCEYQETFLKMTVDRVPTDSSPLSFLDPSGPTPVLYGCPASSDLRLPPGGPGGPAPERGGVPGSHPDHHGGVQGEH